MSSEEDFIEKENEQPQSDKIVIDKIKNFNQTCDDQLGEVYSNSNKIHQIKEKIINSKEKVEEIGDIINDQLDSMSEKNLKILLGVLVFIFTYVLLFK